MRLRILSISIWTYLALSSAALFFVALAIFVATFPFDRDRRVLHLFSCWWAAHYFYVNPFWSLAVEKNPAIDRRQPMVLVINHQSVVDILAVFATYLPFKWVSKASVFKLPFIGWNCTLNGYVPLVRGEKGSIGAMYAACRRWLDRGVSIAMFPEGTRSKDGSLLPFKVGAFRIAREAGVKVLPIVLDGTGGALPKHGFVLRELVRARLRVLSPVDVSHYASDEEAADAIRGLMDVELGKLRETAQAA